MTSPQQSSSPSRPSHVLLWTLLAVAVVANGAASVAGAPLVVGLGSGLVVLLCAWALVALHRRRRS
jgi:hypothetical protein